MNVTVSAISLSGMHVRLEPLTPLHVDGIVAAAANNPELYRWSPIPQGKNAAISYIDTAIALRDAGTAVPFAIIRLQDGAVIGSTRFWNIEQWSWPQIHPRHGSPVDACEIGYTWLSSSAIRTSANTEAKFLMLKHAFQSWRALRVCLHTDARNQRSRAAIERIGGKFEGILRSHRLAADFIPRDSVRYSILAEEWPAVRERPNQLLDRA